MIKKDCPYCGMGHTMDAFVVCKCGQIVCFECTGEHIESHYIREITEKEFEKLEDNTW